MIAVPPLGMDPMAVSHAGPHIKNSDVDENAYEQMLEEHPEVPDSDPVDEEPGE